MQNEADRRRPTDRERWDRKYSAGEGPVHFEPNRLLTGHRPLLSGGRALDVACGFGGNALYLAALGYQVDAIDVSSVALDHAHAEAKRRRLPIQFIQADLSRWWVPQGRYDLIVVFFYLNREFMSHVVAGLRLGGWLFQANRSRHYLLIRPDFDPAYLLEPGELPRLAREAGLEVVYYADDDCRLPDTPHASQLIARRRR